MLTLNEKANESEGMPLTDKFMYFGYGSNLLAKRLRLANKGAERKGSGKLGDHRLDFYTNSTRWNGAPATIVPHVGKHVWGAIWEIDIKHLDDLDRQESVPDGIYIALTVNIETSIGESITCRTYRLTNLPSELSPNHDVPFNRQPSLTYLKTILKGALETGLPDEYISFLRSFKNNGNIVDAIEQELELN